jgi:hypothetical protein
VAKKLPFVGAVIPKSYEQLSICLFHLSAAELNYSVAEMHSLELLVDDLLSENNVYLLSIK